MTRHSAASSCTESASHPRSICTRSAPVTGRKAPSPQRSQPCWAPPPCRVDGIQNTGRPPTFPSSTRAASPSHFPSPRHRSTAARASFGPTSSTVGLRSRTRRLGRPLPATSTKSMFPRTSVATPPGTRASGMPASTECTSTGGRLGKARRLSRKRTCSSRSGLAIAVPSAGPSTHRAMARTRTRGQRSRRLEVV